MSDFDVDALVAELDDVLNEPASKHTATRSTAGVRSVLSQASAAKPSASSFQQPRSNAAASTSNIASSFDLSDDDDEPPPRRYVAAASSRGASSSQSGSGVGGVSGKSAPVPSAGGGFDDDIQSLLSEMDSAMSPSALQPTKLPIRDAPTSFARAPVAGVAAAARSVSKPFSQRSKCFPVTLTSSVGGISGGVSGGCSNLLCTSCDQPVLVLRGQAWRDGVVDYLFFRNHYPDESKLRAGMTRDASASAYACQCSWQTVGASGSGADTLSLSSLDTSDRTKHEGCSAWNTLRWICAGH